MTSGVIYIIPIIYCGGVTDERAIRLAAEMVRDWRYLLAKAREEMLNGPK